MAANPFATNCHLYVWAEGNFTGYRVSVQVRPSSVVPVFAWAGGFLTDGTFIQSGISQGTTTGYPYPWAFQWAQEAPQTRTVNDPAPSWLPMQNAAVGAWYVFTGQLEGDGWHFYVTDPAGVRTQQGTHRSRALLRTVKFEAEPILDGTGWAPFPTQAMRGAYARVGTTWAGASLWYSPIVTPTGSALVKRTAGPNLVFYWQSLT